MTPEWFYMEVNRTTACKTTAPTAGSYGNGLCCVGKSLKKVLKNRRFHARRYVFKKFLQFSNLDQKNEPAIKHVSIGFY